MEKIEGSLEHIVYRNEENGYTVGKLLKMGYAEITTVVGSMMGVQVGETLICEGHWKKDKKFGKQFVVEAFDVKVPSTTRGIELYLASGSVAGVGAVFAKRIVDYFGEKTLAIFDEEPKRLLEVEGIGKKKLERIESAWAKQKDIRQVMIFLQNYGVSPAYAQRIFKVHGQQSIERVKDNPYRLATEVEGIGFKKSDAIAQRMGMDVDAPARIASGIEYTLEQVARMGHSCYPVDGLVKEAAMLLGVAFESVEIELNGLAAKGRVILKLLSYKTDPPKTFAWSKMNYDHEKEISEEVERLQTFEDVFKETDLELALEKSSKKHGITLAIQQEEAVIKSIEDKLHIITGGPGTGKSTITKVVLDICLETTDSIILAAPTGRAAKRLSDPARGCK